MNDSAIPAKRSSKEETWDNGLSLPPLLTALLRQAAVERTGGVRPDASAADWVALMAGGKQP